LRKEQNYTQYAVRNTRKWVNGKLQRVKGKLLPVKPVLSVTEKIITVGLKNIQKTVYTQLRKTRQVTSDRPLKYRYRSTFSGPTSAGHFNLPDNFCGIAFIPVQQALHHLPFFLTKGDSYLIPTPNSQPRKEIVNER